MATYSKLPSGTWRVQVRRKGRYISETFLKRDDARRWATEAEGRIDRGEVPTPTRAARLRTFGELIDLHIDDMKEVEKAPRRSKAATLKMLKARLGRKKLAQLDRQLFIDFGKERANEGAGPMTLSIDIGAIKLVITHAIAVHGLTISAEPVNKARLALKRLGLVGKGLERDRRPTEEELERLIAHFESNPRQTIPMGRVIRFARPAQASLGWRKDPRRRRGRPGRPAGPAAKPRTLARARAEPFHVLFKCLDIRNPSAQQARR